MELKNLLESIGGDICNHADELIFFGDRTKGVRLSLGYFP
tara:strand:- start:479 stop:598 length:120 start_codon:yes stop_codon:yes gene_type:complete